MVLFDAAEIKSVVEKLIARGRPARRSRRRGRGRRGDPARPGHGRVLRRPGRDRRRGRRVRGPEATPPAVDDRVGRRARSAAVPASRTAATDGFGEPPADADIPLAQSVAWDVYCVGRLVRLGFKHYDNRQRRLYDFRNRHGFTDAADAAFERLWTADDLTWADIAALSDEAAAAAA